VVLGVVNIDAETALASDTFESFWRHVSALPVFRPDPDRSQIPPILSIRTASVKHHDRISTVMGLWTEGKKKQPLWPCHSSGPVTVEHLPTEVAVTTSLRELVVYFGPWVQPFSPPALQEHWRAPA
jgi:hypothetical protein